MQSPEPPSTPQRAMRAALSTTPPAWHAITTLVQAHGAAVLDVRSATRITAPALRFTYERPAALHLAVLHGKAELAALLLARGAHVDALAGASVHAEKSEGGGGRTPLFLAVDAWRGGNGRRGMDRIDGMVWLLLRWSADVCAFDEMGNTLLTVAVLQGNVVAVELLARRCPGLVNAASCSGWSALHEAAWSGSVAAAEALVRLGARVDCRTRAGLTPAELALEGRHVEVGRYLVGLSLSGSVGAC
jgi:ankyrin repeat protein